MGIGPIRRPVIQRRARDLPGGIERARLATRPVYFDNAFVDAPIYARRKLQPGDCLDGPAIVEEYGSTTVVFPRLTMRVDAFGNLILERAP
jgi:N-methylhydantoinase A